MDGEKDKIGFINELKVIVEEKSSIDNIGVLTKNRVALTESGTKGLNRWGGYISEEFLPELRYPRAAKIYKEMSSNDATIGAILYMAEQLIRRAEWTVQAGGSSSEDTEAAEFLEECMNDMEETWAEMITEILSMMVYGFSYHERVYKIRRGKDRNKKYNSKYNDGKIGWRKLPGRSQATMYAWSYDEETHELLGMYQLAGPDWKMRFIPIEKALLFRTRPDRGNPEGRSLLRTAYRSWYFKKRIEELEGIGIERDLAGLPVVTPDEQTDIWADDEKAQAKLLAAENMVRNIRRDQNEGVVLPFGWKLELLSAGGQRQFDTNAILNRYDQRIAITLLADIVMLGADKVGSFALADVKKGLLAASLEAQVRNIADLFNKLAIPELMQLNGFNQTNLPKVVPGEIETPSITEISVFLKATSESGFQFADDVNFENFLRGLISAPPRPEDKPMPTTEELYGDDGKLVNNPPKDNSLDNNGEKVKPNGEKSEDMD